MTLIKLSVMWAAVMPIAIVISLGLSFLCFRYYFRGIRRDRQSDMAIDLELGTLPKTSTELVTTLQKSQSPSPGFIDITYPQVPKATFPKTMHFTPRSNLHRAFRKPSNKLSEQQG
ncbi:hypothetical protein AOQ84DRAFT_374932 [Glonium stellatum]|uniref:Uncharacterized protein n=1 Tax=Glonium stellatum TaxID=574774 RepID=A0A8E2F4J9_9PEZI|nr:hypothetical protein AOQ84DRAFT_374932 [Glonium stellatum]